MQHSFLYSRTIQVFIAAIILCSCSSTDSNSGDSGTAGNEGTSASTFDSGIIPAGGTFSFTFTDEGEFEYFCEIHAPDMQGVVQVQGGAVTSARDTIEMINGKFQPGSITVAPNTQIIWINRDQMDHTVVSGNPSSGNAPSY